MIALYIILAVIALIVILFSIKVSVTAVYDETFTLDIKWFFIKLRIYPEDEEKKAKKEDSCRSFAAFCNRGCGRAVFHRSSVRR